MMIEFFLVLKFEVFCLFSVVVLVFNEEVVLLVFYQCLGVVFGDFGDDCEVFYVDDGSIDCSVVIFVQLQVVDCWVGVVCFICNFGKEQVMSVGFKLLCGVVVIVIDVDLQDFLELILQMFDVWIGGVEMVNMCCCSWVGESWLKCVLVSVFYWLINCFSEVLILCDVGDFCLFDWWVVDVFCELLEGNCFMKGLFVWVGFCQVDIVYSCVVCVVGYSKWCYWWLWNFVLEGIIGFFIVLLKVVGYFGLFSLLVVLVILFVGIFGQQEIYEYWLVIVVLFLIGGL